MIPFVNIQGQREAYREELEKAEKAVLDSGIYIGGPEVAALEAELSAYTGTNAVTCASGTDAWSVEGYDFHFRGDLPIGAALSSSASIEMVTAFALNELNGAPFSRVELAQLLCG